MNERRRRVDLVQAFGPGSLADRAEGWVFVATCALALSLVFLADLRLGRASGLGTVGALGFIPVVVAGWLLSRRQAALVGAIAIGFRVLALVAGSVPPVTGVTHVLTVPVLIVLAQLAAELAVRAIAMERQIERMASLDEAKSEFLRLASHELRGPLGVVRGYVSMLDDGTLGELPQSARVVLPILDSRLKSIGLMVDLMLETARMDDERLELRKESTDMGQLVGECLDDMRPIAGDEHPLQLVTSGESLVADADRTRVATIVNNLIDNAIKYSPDGGPVRCRVERINGNVAIAVEDHGLGMAEHQMKKLFGRYARVGEDRAAQIPGTGLGLHVSLALARLHGGNLRVRSRLGQGSTFTLELPAGRE